jgi:hypothetical protein
MGLKAELHTDLRARLGTRRRDQALLHQEVIIVRLGRRAGGGEGRGERGGGREEEGRREEIGWEGGDVNSYKR